MRQWLLIFVVTFLVYGSSLHYGLSQDDFFHLLISRADSWRDVLAFFNPLATHWIFFRPLSTQVWYALFSHLFSLSSLPLAMHLAALLVHATNAYLVGRLLGRVFRLSPRASLTGALLYAISGVHFLSLYYIGATQQLLATLFLLLALRASVKRPVAATFLVTVALLCKEIAVRYTPLEFFILLFQGKNLKLALRSLILPAILTALYLGWRLAYQTGGAAEYALNLSPLTTLATLLWYVYWSLGLPEYLIYFGLSGGRVGWGAYLASVGPLGYLNLAGVLGLVLVLLLMPKTKKHLYLLLLFVIPLLPVLPLSTHRYPHYLDLSLLALLTTLLASSVSRRLKVLAVIAWVTVSLTSQAIDLRTHWTVGRAKIASRAREFFVARRICDYDSVRLVGEGNTPSELSIALSDQNGPEIFCGHPIEVRYGSTRGFTEGVLDITKVVRP